MFLHDSFADFVKVFYLLWFCHYKFDQNVFMFLGILAWHIVLPFLVSLALPLNLIFIRYGFIYTFGRFAYKINIREHWETIPMYFGQKNCMQHEKFTNNKTKNLSKHLICFNQNSDFIKQLPNSATNRNELDLLFTKHSDSSSTVYRMHG